MSDYLTMFWLHVEKGVTKASGVMRDEAIQRDKREKEICANNKLSYNTLASTVGIGFLV